MPEITRFYGIVVKIFFRDEHNPPRIFMQFMGSITDFSGLKTWK